MNLLSEKSRNFIYVHCTYTHYYNIDFMNSVNNDVSDGINVSEKFICIQFCTYIKITDGEPCRR